MPLVNRPGSETPEGVEPENTVTRKTPESIEDIVLEVMSILKYHSVDKIEISKNRLWFRYYPEDTTQEEVIKWALGEENTDTR